MSRTTIIAEAGVNHNGSVELAKQLIDAAAAAGADYVKFQTFVTELNISTEAEKAAYQIENTANKTETQFEMLKKLELSYDQFRELYQYCQLRKIGFLSTAFDEPSVRFLAGLGQKTFKIPSGEITNKPLLQEIARHAQSLIISTGMANLDEINAALEIVKAEGIPTDAITLLHCTTEYPAPMASVNLTAMNTLAMEFGCKTGYSDHTEGIEIPIAAVALGAAVIEKHFTLDRTLPGPDHPASLEPHELAQMVAAIRNVELAMAGDGKKVPATAEIRNKAVARKSLHFAHSLQKGHVISTEDMVTLRPGTGISPMQIDTLLGKKLATEVKAGEIVKPSHF